MNFRYFKYFKCYYLRKRWIYATVLPILGFSHFFAYIILRVPKNNSHIFTKYFFFNGKDEKQC
jgi:hypothetical protein